MKSCIYCDLRFTKKKRRRTIDHVIPISVMKFLGIEFGPKKISKNKIECCRKCNGDKSAYFMGDFNAVKMSRMNEELLSRILIFQLYICREFSIQIDWNK